MFKKEKMNLKKQQLLEMIKTFYGIGNLVKKIKMKLSKIVNLIQMNLRIEI